MLILYPMNKFHSHYLSYLLRLWQVEGESGSGWRASLQNPHTAERLNFASLEELVSYLEEKLCEHKQDTTKDD